MLTYIDKLRGLREDNDLTQAQIAEVLGTSQTMYARYERGPTKCPFAIWLHCADFIMYLQTIFWVRLRIQDGNKRARKNKTASQV